MVKRNLYRALYTLEGIRAARRNAQSSDEPSIPESLGLGRDILNENKF